MKKNGNVYEVRYEREVGRTEHTGVVRQHTGKAVLASDVSLEILHGEPFVAAVHWYEGMNLPVATYVPDTRKYPEEATGESFDVAVYHLARVTKISYAHPEDERAPRHTIEVIRQLTREEVGDPAFDAIIRANNK